MKKQILTCSDCKKIFNVEITEEVFEAGGLEPLIKATGNEGIMCEECFIEILGDGKFNEVEE